jgi:hypothetical protein
VLRPNISLKQLAELYEQRNKLYGDTYKNHGEVVQKLFPLGITLKTVSDHNRFGVLTMIVSKLCRYASNFERGGHSDSLDDLSVYAQMLNELDMELKTNVK